MSRSSVAATAAPARKLLVTTALESTWGTQQPIVFLGEWCKRRERRSAWEARTHDTVPFHWNDSDKLKRDYDYLQALHHSLLQHLTAALNQIHQCHQSLRYWQTLLDPWLMTYVAVMFDRWENLRVAFEQNDDMEMWGDGDHASMAAPFSYSEFIAQVRSEEWNYRTCSRIVETGYPNRFRAKPPDRQVPEHPAPAEQRRSLRRQVARVLDRSLGKMFVKYDVALIHSYFDPLSLVRLNLALGQIPRLFLAEFDDDHRDYAHGNAADRDAFKWTFTPRSPFEAFLEKWIRRDIPACLIEAFEGLRERAKRVPIKTKVIVTANSHWGDLAVKFWCAEQVENGVKLVILEHGGSFPAFKELFNFEEDIADVKGTWFEPYHAKHVRVPPSKLIRRLTKGGRPFTLTPKRNYCSVIDNDYPRWVYRAHFYAMAGQGLASVDLIREWYDQLTGHVRSQVRLKPYVHSGAAGWNTQNLYEQTIGADKVLREHDIDQTFDSSRVIVCTCPETVFSEAMAAGVPTIMIYPERFFPRHPAAGALLDVLRAAKIVFHDAVTAATHTNRIWDDPGSWWDSVDVRNARDAFRKQALYDGNDWLKDWTRFLDGVMA